MYMKIRSKDGSLYEGNIEGGLKQGVGSYSRNMDKAGGGTYIAWTYDGEYESGKFNGTGKMQKFHENGNLRQEYKGEYSMGKREGVGKYTTYDDRSAPSISYIGWWKDDLYDGLGKFDQYEGGVVKETFKGRFEAGVFKEHLEVDENDLFQE